MNWSRRHTAFRSVCFALIGALQYDIPVQVDIIINMQLKHSSVPVLTGDLLYFPIASIFQSR